MRRLFTLVTGVLLVAGGATVVIIAGRHGWLPGIAGGASSQDCPHGLSSENCPFCDPSLVERLGQCPGHEVPEAFCTRCNPSLVVAFQAVGDWCVAHELPESQCAICNPGLLSADPAPGRSTASRSVELLSRRELPRSRRLPSVTCVTSTLRVQFASPEIAAAAGLAYAPVERRKITETVTANAELTFDGNRYAHLSSRASGVVRKVKADLGQRVEAGELLATIDSIDLGAAKAEYLQAAELVKLWERNYTREKRLNERRIGTESELLQAETKLAESRISLSRHAQQLRNLGLSDDQTAAVIEKEDASSLLPLTAPFPGMIVERSLALGEVVDTSRTLFAIADTSTMWAMLDVYEYDLVRLQQGLPVVLGVEGLRGERYAGRITWVSSHVDPRTRTLKARAEVANPDGMLRAGMFGKAIVNIREKEPALVVPKDAVQWEGCCNVVFVRKSDVLFEPRKVRLGYETERWFVVENGVEEGDIVVTTGSFLLKTEILKGSIGAGCCEVNPAAS